MLSACPCWTRLAFTFSIVVRVADEGGKSISAEMKKTKRFVLITLAICVTIDLFVLWMLW
jgi:hypothetical protein